MVSTTGCTKIDSPSSLSTGTPKHAALQMVAGAAGSRVSGRSRSYGFGSAPAPEMNPEMVRTLFSLEIGFYGYKKLILR